jgi:hypothetical protein
MAISSHTKLVLAMVFPKDIFIVSSELTLLMFTIIVGGVVGDEIKKMTEVMHQRKHKA